MNNRARDAYRRAAIKVLGVSKQEAETYIINPDDDTGENAPGALVVIYLEADCREKGDEGVLPDLLGYYTTSGPERCVDLANEAGVGYIEYINGAVAAVYPA